MISLRLRMGRDGWLKIGCVFLYPFICPFRGLKGVQKGSGRADHCIVAEDNGRVVGAVWTRIMDDYGHVDDETPSFAISLYKEYRGKGYGTELMRQMLELLRKQGCGKASLAVQKANYAVRMYKKLGFRTTDENAEEYIMVCEL